MGNKTPLYDAHVKHNARIVDFGGWDMPLHYGSQIEEHHEVRRSAGMFDVSHMTVLELRGDKVVDFLRKLLANDVARIKDKGKALYSCMLNENGGVIDDLIVYYMDDNWFRMVVNAATHDKDVAWITKQAQAFAVEVDEPAGLAMIAVQGPEARDKVHQVIDKALAEKAAAAKRFYAVTDGETFIGRTGYTGEDGYEIILPANKAMDLWEALYNVGVRPAGLGARDTLRLEAGMNLYGTDMDEKISPLEAGLGWTIAWEPADRDFIGRKVIEQQRGQSDTRKLVGLILEGKGVLRNHQKVFVNEAEGEITSGSFSPTLGKAIAFARIPENNSDQCEVDMRGKRVVAMIVKPPFVRDGKACL
ncbi:MAG: glycine cleavage system aminomethyltransferase GcvT [Gammaproteobacteria bacterium]|nr:glycine cleavage system aminomethyltransferase GcvT [Gammaproteobacteria bacterium]